MHILALSSKINFPSDLNLFFVFYFLKQLYISAPTYICFFIPLNIQTLNEVGVLRCPFLFLSVIL